MNWKSLIAVVGLGLCASCGTSGESDSSEQCGNQIDDDQDGLADCQDPNCNEDAICAGAGLCTAQTQCFGTHTYDDYRNNPMPLCLHGQGCSTPPASIDIHFQVKRRGYVGTEVGSVNTRFIKKVAVDGTAVNCARIQEIASSNSEQDAGQIEATGLFNFQAFDTTPVGPPVGDTVIPINAFSVTTGADFLIWTELWAGKPNSNTGLPTGNRYGYVCVETGLMVEEIKPEHDWADSVGSETSRTITVEVGRL